MSDINCLSYPLPRPAKNPTEWQKLAFAMGSVSYLRRGAHPLSIFIICKPDLQPSLALNAHWVLSAEGYDHSVWLCGSLTFEIWSQDTRRSAKRNGNVEQEQVAALAKDRTTSQVTRGVPIWNLLTGKVLPARESSIEYRFPLPPLWVAWKRTATTL